MRTLKFFLIVTVLAGGVFGCDDDSNNTSNNITNNTTNNTTNNVSCGNNLIEALETCDGTDLGGNDCSSIGQGYTGGSLSCSSDCSSYDVSQCTTGNPDCGNGIIEGTETCDGTDLGEETCLTVEGGFTGGQLQCNSTCDGYITSNCVIISQECGNGTIESGESCDGDALGTNTCESLGFSGGILKCNDNCTFNASDCTAPSCGDGEINGLEACEASDLNGQSCVSLGQGFVGGELLCNANCQFDTTNCLTCGNDVINSGEICDSSNLNGQSCETIGHGYIGGSLACNSTCDGWDVTGCTEPDCGDNLLHGLETCDGTNLDGQNCASIGMGYTGGVLACNDSCDGWNVEACTLPPCGDGLIEGNEVCDSDNLNGQSCTSIPGGYVSGVLACNDQCDGYDDGLCVLPACGDGSKNGDELCDGDDVGTATCLSLGEGYYSGTLRCDETCYGYDVSECLAPFCGDNSITGDEVCDGTSLNGKTCVSLGEGYIGGLLACNGECNGYDTTNCIEPTCGNYVIEGLEDCDTMELNGDDCTDHGFSGGTLACGSNCKFDFDQCTDGCGNNFLEGTEECDGTDLGGALCSEYGFVDGAMNCNADCSFNYDSCNGGCGNNTVDGTEVCDGTDTAGVTCESLGLMGDVACASDCGSLDTTGCQYVYANTTANFAWIELNADQDATAITTLDDYNYSGPFNIGFDFNYYGYTKNQFYISANGFISFDEGLGVDSNVCPLSGSYSYFNLIAPYWDDLNPDLVDSAYYKKFESCPWGLGDLGCTIVEFDNFHHYSWSDTNIAGTFEIIMFEDGNILVQIKDAGVENGADSTTGIIGPTADDSTTYSCNSEDINDETSICFVAPGTSGCY